MRQLTRPRTVLAGVAAVVLLVGGAVGAYVVSHSFGHHKVRSGLPSGLPKLTVTSTDLRAHQEIPQQFWGCTSPGVSPQLSWSRGPASTKSYAVLVFDPDAPTGSGYWHWVAWDIPASTTSLATGAVLPAGSVNGENDGGTFGYTGPCPPAGDRVHHYELTVVALKVAGLGLDPASHGAVAAFTIGQNAVASGQIVADASQ